MRPSPRWRGSRDLRSPLHACLVTSVGRGETEAGPYAQRFMLKLHHTPRAMESPNVHECDADFSASCLVDARLAADEAHFVGHADVARDWSDRSLRHELQGFARRRRMPTAPKFGAQTRPARGLQGAAGSSCASVTATRKISENALSLDEQEHVRKRAPPSPRALRRLG